MSRSLSWFGLIDEAINFLEYNAVKVPASFCPHCNKTLSYRINKIPYSEVEPWYDGPYQLYEYELKDHSIVREIVQEIIWDSGPNVFLCLEKEDGERIFEWSDTEEELN